ncbi:hypothetical protein [Thermophilibacter immobilis]|jgi:hypothetical protein|uniref:Uncharacterized protein n=1 Tax=Thermophilibacter immobilis TaxID=2779519 RepID=A0A7S7RU84_9ACTN|nr:hypothetical protein [Thermophilibacter immobilis]QOY60182.1 hypothetical protein INP52_07110 [Thermophilibacter immobilis]
MPLGFIPILMPLHCVLKMVEYRLAPIMMCPLLILVCVAAFVTWALGELGVSHDAYGRAQPRELPLRI